MYTERCFEAFAMTFTAESCQRDPLRKRYFPTRLKKQLQQKERQLYKVGDAITGAGVGGVGLTKLLITLAGLPPILGTNGRLRDSK